EWKTDRPNIPLKYQSSADPANCGAASMEQVAQSLKTIKEMFAEQYDQRVRDDYERSRIAPPDDTKIFMTRQTMMRDLPIFSGEPEEWAAFIATYERTTKSCRFSNEENLARLQKCLKGSAKEATSSLMVTPLNVSAIIETLRSRFGKPRIIIARLIDRARNASSVKEGK
ncbi:unnamed protein product, partial [Allacma fusca]